MPVFPNMLFSHLLFAIYTHIHTYTDYKQVWQLPFSLFCHPQELCLERKDKEEVASKMVGGGGRCRTKGKNKSRKEKFYIVPSLDIDMTLYCSQTKEPSCWSQRNFIAIDMIVVTFSKS